MGTMPSIVVLLGLCKLKVVSLIMLTAVVGYAFSCSILAKLVTYNCCLYGHCTFGNVSGGFQSHCR